MKIKKLSPVDQLHINNYGKKILNITRIVCEFYGVSPEDTFDKDSHENFVKVRRLIQYESRKLLGASCPFSIIGYLTGGFDHTSVIYNCRKMDSLLECKTLYGAWVNTDLRNEYQKIHGRLVNELSKLKSGDKKGVDSVNIWLSADVSHRLSSHCKSTGITKSMFVRSLVIDELNRLQNVI